MALALLAPAPSAQASPDAEGVDPPSTQLCASGIPCPTAEQYRARFERGEWGRTTGKTGWPPETKQMVIDEARRQGHINASGLGPGDWWDGFVNALDCVAPGAESACRDDVQDVAKLKQPAKVVLGCGGAAVVIYYTGGGAAMVGPGLLGCSWQLGVDNW